jgi:2'-5' RNA ligase
MSLGAAEGISAPEKPVTAIDIALEPDQTMTGHAQAANAALLKNFPKGFPLDATHHPHISIFAGFVPTADLPKIYAAAGEVLAKEKYTTWKLTAFKYYYIPMGPIGLGGIVVEPTPHLLRLQEELIDGVARYTVKTASAAAFYTTPAEPDINPSVIEYIAAFSDHVGENFSPHVTIGIGTKAFLDGLLNKPFTVFTFSPVSASVYQFGDYGAARKRLKALPPKN